MFFPIETLCHLLVSVPKTSHFDVSTQICPSGNMPLSDRIWPTLELPNFNGIAHHNNIVHLNMPDLIALPTLICPTCCCTEATATLKCMPEKKEEDEEKLFIIIILLTSVGPVLIRRSTIWSVGLSWSVVIWEFCTDLKVLYTFWTDQTQVEWWACCQVDFGVKRNFPHSHQVPINTAQHTRLRWICHFCKAWCQNLSLDDIYRPIIGGNFELLPDLLTEEKLDGLALQAMLGDDLKLKHVAQQLLPSYTIPSQSQALLLTYVVVGVITPFLFSFYDTVQGYSYQAAPRPCTATVVKKEGSGGRARNSPSLGRCLVARCAAQIPTVTDLPSAFPLYPNHHRLGSAKPNLLADG